MTGDIIKRFVGLTAHCILVGLLILLEIKLGQADSRSQTLISLNPHEHLITLLATNDIHGGVEASLGKDGKKQGGGAILAGVIQSMKQGLIRKYGSNSGVVVLDAGDQFQGTLLSNFTEGELVYEMMNEVGYDAVVPGNHAYDFGPKGWLQDRVTPDHPDQNPRGVLEHLAKDVAKFPLLSANTYLKTSIFGSNGIPVDVKEIGCTPQHGSVAIQWEMAKRPEFLKAYQILNAGDVRVAIIGIDNRQTPQTTTSVNVSDLCFRDEVETYLEVRKALEGKADLFVLVLHDGNMNHQHPVNQMVEKLTQDPSHPLVDAVIAGHTHQVNLEKVKGVPIVQSLSGGRALGRIDLIWNDQTKRVIGEKTRAFAGVHLLYQGCDRLAAAFCQFEDDLLTYEGVEVVLNQKIEKMVSNQRSILAPIAERVIGTTENEIFTDRIQESPLADQMTDILREISGADVSLMNTGGIRAPLFPGTLTYEDLFRVLPFSNHAWAVGPMSVDQILQVLSRSIASCGRYGSLMQSGLKVKFSRNCDLHRDDVDPNAHLIRVEKLDGTVLYDSGQVRANSSVQLKVATLDYIADGGAGYQEFKGVPLIRDFGIAREEIAKELFAHPRHFSSSLDGRWSLIPSSRP